jgi:hypothetical protein
VEKALEACGGCGLVAPGGAAGCQAIMDKLMAKGFSDAAYGRVHRLFVDTYCLQHPDPYCVSFKSFAAHLTSVCWSLEHGGSTAMVSEPLRKWVERHPHLEKPPVPAARGALTIADVARAPDPAAHVRAVDEWARSTWTAYASVHSVVRQWVEAALVGAASRT